MRIVNLTFTLATPPPIPSVQFHLSPNFRLLDDLSFVFRFFRPLCTTYLHHPFWAGPTIVTT
ncbi:unnamed protein product [Meloidogyne enterolobii]|uniref:Uncharacterized protein n=1 Tax=Meloidogyne enterolobii TaxID=390850 RepID=A0ACB0XTB3_MELEN